MAVAALQIAQRDAVLIIYLTDDLRLHTEKETPQYTAQGRPTVVQRQSLNLMRHKMIKAAWWIDVAFIAS